ncbi:hypothetical protein PPACK8108_LOCUS7542 [Phakopsora pachyrhizi]|uniref:Uncharacterized protein n=1 Tax=Phakopsora pachyrhizi TaxID=170000 RepID=A0AAV0AT42_PHAPC|nr:hypothetical protein PPACK8108_LOCUS7542 [Phakopsora pachyrhizi]
MRHSRKSDFAKSSLDLLLRICSFDTVVDLTVMDRSQGDQASLTPSANKRLSTVNFVKHSKLRPPTEMTTTNPNGNAPLLPSLHNSISMAQTTWPGSKL